MTTTATNTTPAAAPAGEAAVVLAAAKEHLAALEKAALAADEGRTSIEAAKDRLAALEHAAADGLDVDAADYNNAQTAVSLKGRRQGSLEAADIEERKQHIIRLYEAAAISNAAVQANVEELEALLNQAKQTATAIGYSNRAETYEAAGDMNLPLVDYLGDLDGLLGIKVRSGLQPLPVKYGNAYRLQGRVFDQDGEIMNSNHNRPHRG